MTFAWAMILGFGLGLRHATDADHVAAIGALPGRETSPVKAARVAAFWGIGHTLTLSVLGGMVILAGVHPPPPFERAADAIVAVMLISLGSWTLFRGQPSRPAGSLRWRPLLAGLAHGLAGSAGVALIALTTIPSRLRALAYLALFGAGTVAGMTLLTVLLSLPLGWSARKCGLVPRAPIVAAALVSVGFGVAIAIRLASTIASGRP